MLVSVGALIVAVLGWLGLAEEADWLREAAGPDELSEHALQRLSEEV